MAPYLRGVAEFDWSHKGTEAGLPHHRAREIHCSCVIRLRQLARAAMIYTGPPGVHCHFPVWSADDDYIYFMRGVPPDDWDLWRIRPPARSRSA